MDETALVSEIEEMIARIETLNRAQTRGRGPAACNVMSASALRLYRDRQARLWWLKQLRRGMLAQRTKTTKLH
jgi:hypothetical protein